MAQKVLVSSGSQPGEVRVKLGMGVGVGVGWGWLGGCVRLLLRQKYDFRPGTELKLITNSLVLAVRCRLSRIDGSKRIRVNGVSTYD